MSYQPMIGFSIPRKFSPRNGHFLPIHESFLPWKFPAIRYIESFPWRKFSPFLPPACSHGRNFILQVFYHMLVITQTLWRSLPHGQTCKYFCNARVGVLDEIYVQRKILVILHVYIYYVQKCLCTCAYCCTHKTLNCVSNLFAIGYMSISQVA